MSNQIQATGAVKIRSLTGVLTGASGVVSSVPLGAANGVATLDSLGKVPLSQLPASVVTYLGTWNAATNTPTLTNGVGDVGDLYICNVAGTVNFGAGPITFAVGDWVIYSGTTWQKSSGASGTVTSVAVTETSDALSITGSPITTSGTINIGFAGTTGQYVNGAGGLTTFPTLTGYVPYVGATANLDLGTYGLISDFVQFNLSSSAIPTTEGTMSWNNTDGTADLIMKGGNVTLQIGQEQLLRVVNKTGVDLLEASYSSVYLSGAQGQRPKVNLALANNSVNSSATLGLVTENIPNNLEGFITTSGMVREINTTGSLQGETWSEGQALYLSATTAGAVTNIPPIEPNHRIVMGYVIYAHAVHGSIFVKVSVGLNLDELNDVEVTAPSNNDGLFFNSSTNIWQHKSIATALGYTPANDSLVVHLAGIETITGIKSFSSIIYANSGVQVPLSGTASPTTLQNISSVGIVSIGRNMLGFNSNNNLYFAGDNKGYCEFAYNNAGSGRTYTLPNTSGTVALTSDIPSLSGYVTLDTTQTITGQKTFTNSQTFELGLYIKNSVQLSSSGYLGIGANTDRVYFGLNGTSQQSLVFPTTSRAYTFPDVAGTIVLGTGTSGYLTKWNGTNTVNGSVIYDNGTNVGIGNTASSGYKLDVTGTGRFSGYLYANAKLEVNDANGLPLRFGDISAAITGQTAGYIGMSTSAFSGNNGDLVLYPRTSATSKILLMGGNVGIGTSSPSYTLDVQYGGNISQRIRNNAAGGTATLLLETANTFSGTSQAYIQCIGASGNGTSQLVFATAGASGDTTATERMRIASGGFLLVGSTTSLGASYKIQSTGPGGFLANTNGTGDASFYSTSSSVAWHFYGDNAVSTTFYVLKNGDVRNTNNSYGAISDISLKENIVDASPKLADLLKVKIRNYHLIADENKEKQIGVIAQELEEIFPNMISDDKQMGSDETIKTVKYSVFVPMLIKAIQEQQAIITDLNERLSKLENK